MSTDHVVCVVCGDVATHVTAYIRPRGLAPKVYAWCGACDDTEYHVAPLHL